MVIRIKWYVVTIQLIIFLIQLYFRESHQVHYIIYSMEAVKELLVIDLQIPTKHFATQLHPTTSKAQLDVNMYIEWAFR